MNWKDMFTEKDNSTLDVAKVLATFAIFSGVSLAIVSVVYKNTPLNMQDYGIGIGALFAGVGVALGMKKESGE